MNLRKLLFVLFLTLPVCLYGQKKGQTKIDSLLGELSSGKYRNDTNEVKLLLQIAGASGPRDSAAAYAHKGLKLAEKIDYKYGQGTCLAALGHMYYSDLDIGLGYYLSALKVFEQIGDEPDVIEVLQWIGGLYFNMSKFPQALDYFTRSLRLCERASDKNHIANAYHCVAATYMSLENFTMGLEYESSALKFYEESGRQVQIGNSYANMGECYARLKDYNKAMFYSAASIRILQTLYKGDFDYNYASALSCRGYIHYMAAMDSTTILKPDSLLPAGKTANLAKAIEYYRVAYSIYLKCPQFVFPEILDKLSMALTAAGQYKEALQFSRQFIALKDTMLSQNVTLKIAGHETKREADLKDRQIEVNRVQHANEIKERILFTIIIALLAVVLLLIWRTYKRQKTANAKIEEEKKKLESVNAHITEEKKRSDQLAASLQESLVKQESQAEMLSRATEMKTRFLGNISHELRTPVTLITGMLELMKNNEREGTDKGSQQLEMAYNNSRRLQQMVEELLDLSRPEGSASQLNCVAKEVGPTLKRIINTFEGLIQKEGILLKYSTNNIGGLYISIDEYHFEKIINNLIYNAIKFNVKAGSIVVLANHAIGKKQIKISISNTGPSISAADLPHVFERFYQGDTSKARAEGAGIGLALVKEFTQLLGGSVAVSSSPEAGTTFTLQFPLVEKNREEETPFEEPTAPDVAWEHFERRQMVLLVEDKEEMRYYLKEVLGEKVDIAEAGNGKEALEWLQTHKPDLIISDIMMPEMDGRELVQRLKEDEELKKVPVITLTALADKDTQVGMLRMGVDDYIIKPFNATELQVRVYNLLKNNIERISFAQQPAEPDDLPRNSAEAEEFRNKIIGCVAAGMKNTNLSVADIAYALALSERQLYRIAKSLTGCSPAQLIKEVRLQKAYELLQGGNIYKIDDVAKRVGFDSAGYFSRLFLDRFGKRPSEFL
jgi:signal transduction histidine kinase/DNA-binding response OmpR family regulator